MKTQIVYKVIEERMSPSGRVEYFTLPLYKTITEDEAKGIVLFKPKETMADWMLNKWGITCTTVRTDDDQYVHAFNSYESALEYMQEHFKGYFYTRPVIYECEAELADSEPEDGCKLRCKSIKFIRPIAQMVNFKVNEYVAMQKPEKKKSYGIQYDESEINGDTDYNE